MAPASAGKAGPLSGTTVIELAGIGPGPFCGMLLADMGADVICVERPVRDAAAGRPDVVNFRGRRSIGIDLKHRQGVEIVLQMCREADVLIEGYRPGVAERLGVGPEPCRRANAGLVYGRITGWGQDGPLAALAGHDINYIALSGALHGIGREGAPPVAPLNLVGDGGGGLLLAFGIASALVERGRSGQGQVVDASMVEGSALLASVFFGLHAQGLCGVYPGENYLGGAAPFYDVYETRTEAGQEKQFISVGALEPKFYRRLVTLAGLAEDECHPQGSTEQWPARKARMRALFLSRTRDEWCRIFDGADACFAPVLSLREAPDHPHNKARGSFVDIGGIVQPAPAPQFGRSRPGLPAAAPEPGQHTDEILRACGFSPERIDRLRRDGAVFGPSRASG